VKWDARPDSRRLRGEAVVLSKRLRTEAAWPVPSQSALDTGEVRFVIQELMPGSPCEYLDHRLADQLLDLHQRRLGLARPGDPVHWPGALTATEQDALPGLPRPEESVPTWQIQTGLAADLKSRGSRSKA